MGKAQSEDGNRDLNYLLGQMTETEREAVREQLLTDAEAFNRLRDAENDLFDAYAGGTLSAGQRSAFERTLLRQPDAAAKLRASRALVAPVRRKDMRRLLWIPAAIAAAVAAFFWGGPDARKVGQPETPPAAIALVTQSFRLTPVTRSAGTVPELALAAATSEVEFIAEVPAGPQAMQYAVAVERGAEEVWVGTVTAAARELRWRMPVPAAGAYVIRVGSKADPLAFYEVRITRQR